MKPTAQSTITLSITKEEKAYLSLFAVANHTSKKAILDKSISTAVRRLRSINSPDKLKDRLALNILCRWKVERQKNTTLDSFIQEMEDYLRTKGIQSTDISQIIQKFINAKKKDNGFNQTNAEQCR